VRADSVAGVIGITLLVAVGATAADRTYRVDPSRSRATIHVGKAGAFSFIAGHTHEIVGPIESGSIDVDLDALPRSRVTLVIAAAELKVSAKGEPEGDPPKVQEAMSGEKVLDVARHPRITFESTGATLQSRRGTLLDLMVSGTLTIRDVAQPVTVPVHVDIADASLTASGRFTIKQSAFGIKPVSVGGVVAVKDALDIDFSIVAAR
jgi:polyisoprenoid-binding protein YceI